MSKNKETKSKKIEAIYNYLNEMPEEANIDIEHRKRIFFNKINARKTNSVNKYLKYAAVLVILISSTYFLTIEDESSITPTVVNTNTDEIQIGTDKAILTLEDGSEVALEKGKTVNINNVKSDGEKLVYQLNNREEEIKYNYLTVPRGGQFFVQLSDGTNVWLNSDSKLKYPIAFKEHESRKVELLYGEAYFDVSSSKNHHNANFVVTTQNQDIEVLGTQFNVKAYKQDDFIATTLVEGEVIVGSNNDNKRTLEPNQQSRFNKVTNHIDVVPVDVYYEISWKNGLFSFKNKPLKDIMMVISRWYDVDIVYKNEKALDVTFNGVFNKKQNIEEILSIIENTKEATFKTQGKVVFMK